MTDLEYRICVAVVLLAFAVAGGAVGHLDWEYRRWRRLRRMERRGGWL